jgi:glycosyltransferase involved in cell wall biosynthesis
MSTLDTVIALPRRARRSIVARSTRRLRHAIRAVLMRVAALPPSRRARRDADRRVVLVIASAWGMGGTIRAALNLGGFLDGDRDVEVLSAHRRRETPFMGAFPEGLRVTALDDQRDGAQTGLTGRLAGWLRRYPSVLFDPRDEAGAPGFTIWTDVQLVRRLARGAGVVITSRPGLNLLVADLALPGWIKLGQEQMNLGSLPRPVRREIARRYDRLDALAVLTEADRDAYRALLGERAPRIAVMPNTVHRIPEEKSDLEAKLVLAAGRATGQKGFDLLIRAWAKVVPEHPDWTLRLYCHGQARPALLTLKEELGLDDERLTIYLGAKKLPLRMQQSSIYALSSRFEGFPLILLEAMGAGMGVVAFDCPTGPSDVIDDHRNGLLVPPRDVDAFAAALKEMIEDEALRRSCAAAAIQTAHEYTMDAIGPRWAELIADLRAGRR